MTSRRVSKAFLLLMMFPLFGAAGQKKPGRSPCVLTEWLQQKNYAVRFVYVAPISVTFGPNTPATFRQVQAHSPHAGAWTTGFPLGVTQWISPNEMKGLAERLEKLNLVWDISPKPMVFRKELIEPPPPPDSLIRPWKLPEPRHKGTMEIDVTCDAGSAVADLPVERICASMRKLASGLHEHQDIEAFRCELVNWGCKAPYNGCTP
jgi:hypothetical protein